VVVALAAILTLTTPNLPQAEAQARVTTVTVYVPVVQPVYVTVLQTVQVTVTMTQSLSYTWYSTSYSVTWYSTTYSVTQWSTSLTTALGMLGALPSTIFGTYSDLALIGTGAVLGAALAVFSFSLAFRDESGRTLGTLNTGWDDEGEQEWLPHGHSRSQASSDAGPQSEVDGHTSVTLVTGYQERGDDDLSHDLSRERGKKGRSNTPDNDKD